MKKKSRKITAPEGMDVNEGIIGMMISLHTFPLESEADLQQKKKIVSDLKKISNKKR